MFGFVFGTLCLGGFIALAVHRRRAWRRFHGPFGAGNVLHGVLGRLETTPGQEKVIRQAVDTLKEKAWQARSILRESRKGVSQAVGSPMFDEGALRKSFEEQGATLRDVQEGFAECAAKVHEVLDDKQRKVLADMLEAGPMFLSQGFGHSGRHFGHNGHHACAAC